jgi:hypothetical protein
LQATAKAIRELPEKVNIEWLAGHSIHFHALGCETQGGRAPA